MKVVEQQGKKGKTFNCLITTMSEHWGRAMQLQKKKKKKKKKKMSYSVITLLVGYTRKLSQDWKDRCEMGIAQIYKK